MVHNVCIEHGSLVRSHSMAFLHKPSSNTWTDRWQVQWRPLTW